MEQIFTAFLLTSAIGTALALVLALLRPVTRKSFSVSWHYYMWLIVLLAMVLPVKLNMPEPPAQAPSAKTAAVADNQAENVKAPEIAQTQQKQVIPKQAAKREKVSKVRAVKNFLSGKNRLFSLIWLTGALLLFMIRLAGYLAFLIKIHRHSEAVSCPEIREYTNRKIKTRVSGTICSPLLTGIVRPTLLLPETDITQKQLHNVLAHEMTHLKRNDILYKWFVSIVKCIHWFNPAIYFIGKQINIDCEISCDLEAVKQMDESAEREYMETILSLLTHNNSKSVPLTTGMTGNKEILKRRFIMIKNRKKIGKARRILSAVLAAAILTATLLTSGVLATAVFEDNSNISLSCNGEVINFTHKPFYENNTVYLPVRELFEKIGVTDNADSKIDWDNGKVYVTLANSIVKYYGIEIGSNMLYASSNGPLSDVSKTKLSLALTSAPAILRNSTTYIPYEFIDYMLYRGLAANAADCPYNITCVVSGEPGIAYVTPAMTWPSEGETVSGSFGKRVHPATGEERNHNGIDISAPENSPVISAVRGVVTDTGFDAEFGNYVIIENDNGIKLYYGHLSAVEVAEGDKTEQKSVIGRVGKTGEATGANLHFEIQINGEYYNPSIFWQIPDNADETAAAFSEEEIQSAKAVVERYFKAKNEKDRSAVLATVTEPLRTPNTVFWEDEKITVNNIAYDADDQMRKDYTESGRGSVNNTAVENVIVFRVDFTVSVPADGKSAYSNGDYKDYCMILIRDNKNSQWLIDDMGY